MSLTTNKKVKEHRHTGELLRNSSMFYLVLGVVGALVCFYSHRNLQHILRPPADQSELLQWLTLGLLGTGVLTIQSYLFEEFFPSFKSLRGLLTRFMGAVPTLALLYLSLIATIAEEILFRGAIQPAIGLVGAALLFGLLHIGPTGRLSSWSVWAVVAGLLLGWMFEQTSSLWPGILTHSLVNVISMLRMRRDYRSLLEKAKQQRARSVEAGGDSEDPVSR